MLNPEREGGRDRGSGGKGGRERQRERGEGGREGGKGMEGGREEEGDTSEKEDGSFQCVCIC